MAHSGEGSLLKGTAHQLLTLQVALALDCPRATSRGWWARPEPIPATLQGFPWGQYLAALAECEAGRYQARHWILA